MDDNSPRTVSVRGIEAAVRLVTAQAADMRLSQADVLAGCPPAEALLALTVLAAGVVNAVPLSGRTVLQHFALAAAEGVA